jgi:hypothetical protein
VRIVLKLNPSDLARVVVFIDGAASHISRHGSVPEQAAELIRWAESSGGPGLKDIRRALEHFSLLPGKMPPTFKLITADGQPPPIRRLMHGLRQALRVGDLRDSELGKDVLATLRYGKDVKLAESFDPSKIIAAIWDADACFTLVRLSAGQRDWQRDFAQAATPVLVGIAWSLERSADAQAVVLRLCDMVAKRLRLKLIWPADADDANDLKNAIYTECFNADVLECDDVLLQLKRLKVTGPE